jgi:hypothetical protein
MRIWRAALPQAKALKFTAIIIVFASACVEAATKYFLPDSPWHSHEIIPAYVTIGSPSRMSDAHLKRIMDCSANPSGIGSLGSILCPLLVFVLHKETVTSNSRVSVDFEQEHLLDSEC